MTRDARGRAGKVRCLRGRSLCRRTYRLERSESERQAENDKQWESTNHRGKRYRDSGGMDREPGKL